jgi:hypothetical protein
MQTEKIKLLIGCEESDTVRNEFEKLGFYAVSCDLQPNRNVNANHYQGNIFDIINENWDCLIAFPPCTHLAVSGAPWFEQKIKDGRQKEGINFFLSLANSNIKHIAIENPVGIMSNIYKKPTQIIQPYYFGDEFKKTTCLWLKNLPKLYHNKQIDLFENNISHVKPVIIQYNSKKSKTGKRNYSGGAAKWYKNKDERSKDRSKTFPGIAKAMAKQWGEYLLQKYS